jgi:hypothetical protein
MKKAICLSDSLPYMTKGKAYGYRELELHYELKNDKTAILLFRKDRFKDILEEREKKLKKLGI